MIKHVIIQRLDLLSLQVRTDPEEQEVCSLLAETETLLS